MQISENAAAHKIEMIVCGLQPAASLSLFNKPKSLQRDHGEALLRDVNCTHSGSAHLSHAGLMSDDLFLVRGMEMCC